MTQESNITVAASYARALFELAGEQQVLPVIEDDLAQLAGLLVQMPDFARFVESPAISIQQKQDMVQKVLREKVHRLTFQFLQVVCRKERLYLLPAINRSFRQMVQAVEGKLQVVATTAIPLPENELRQLEQQIGQIAGQPVELVHKINPDLIGGMTLLVNGMLMDSSIQSHLKTFYHRISRFVQESTHLEARFIE